MRPSQRMLLSVINSLRAARAYWRLPEPAKREERRDLTIGLFDDPGIERSVEAGLAWLGRAQDNSLSRDGGVARHYSLRDGWSPSYPETTGYIIPTLLECADESGDEAMRARARRMLDWLVSIQMPDGGFQGGMIGQTPVVSVTFNTGQILLGLAAGVRVFGDAYRPALQRAADWLVSIQDRDGCWRKGSTPFAQPGVKVYETHVAWGMLEAARVAPGRGYDDSGLRQIEWALSRQRENGWFNDCCLSEPSQPLTHTIGYVLRGLLEGWRYSKSESLLASARRCADGALGALGPDGLLPGRLDSNWRGSVDWVCLTGSSQIAYCWFMLYEATGEPRFLDAARWVNRYVRQTVRLDGDPDTRGAVKGSFPVSGGYCTFEYPNWATKFFIDANRYEQRCHSTGGC